MKRNIDIYKEQANRFFQEAKSQLEMSGNLKKEIRNAAAEALNNLYQVVLSFHHDYENMVRTSEAAVAAHKEQLLELQSARVEELEKSRNSTREDLSGPLDSVNKQLGDLRELFEQEVLPRIRDAPMIREAPSQVALEPPIEELRGLSREAQETRSTGSGLDGALT